MTFSITEGREDRIGSLVITKELYDKLEKYSLKWINNIHIQSWSWRC